MEENIIIEAIQTLKTDFQHRYNEEPRFVKVPLWVKIKLRDYVQELLTNFNYKELDEKKEDFRIFNLLICPTITIQRLDEMEVF